MNNNTAFVAKLGNIQKIEGADKIVSASIVLNNITVTQVIVGVETKENTPIIYFDSNLCINQDIIDSIDKLSSNFGQEGFKSLNTYLANGNRVRCIKLKGCISNGLAIEVKKFYQFFKNEEQAKKILIEGYSFTEINGKEICKKWLPPVSKTSNRGNKEKKGNKKRISRIIPELFHFHVETQQLLRNLHIINEDQVISISRKIHGTSSILSYCPVKRKLNMKDCIVKFFKIPIIEIEYDYLYASRTVIKNDTTNLGYYNVDLWTQVGKEQLYGKLHKGETIYYEIVGYIPNTNKFIQKNYDYGCKEGQYKIAVYRITYTNEDGKVFEYSWQAMKERCKELNVSMVEEYYYGKVKDLYKEIDYTKEDWRNDFVENLKKDYLEKDCKDNLCKRVPDEGIVIRIETKDIEVYELKSERFYLHESTLKEDENNVDIEEDQQNETIEGN